VTARELRTLRALTARLVPGPPDDPDPGALEAGAAEAIDRFLRAFDADDPPIHAARDGGFVPLDGVAEQGWRVRLERLAQRFSAGVALLDRLCRETYGVEFADASTADRDALLDAPDEELTAFVGLALMLTLEVMYGPPQYGGNDGGTNWKPLGWPGFTQPRGFTAAEVSEPDAGTTASGEALTQLRSGLPADAGWR
jgi:gluconate 2-dehydrogenase gamma chain